MRRNYISLHEKELEEKELELGKNLNNCIFINGKFVPKKVLDKEQFMRDEIGVYIDVVSYNILIKCIKIKDNTTSGFVITPEHKERIERGAKVGLVIGMGPEAYTPPEKFPFGPHCQIGDWIVFNGLERDPLPVNGYPCICVRDDKVVGIISREDVIKSISGATNNIELCREAD